MTGKGIPKATVDIVNEDGEIVKTVVTNESGNIFVEDLEEGSYTIKVKSIPEGYKNPGTQSVSVTGGKTVTKYMTVKKDLQLSYGGVEQTEKIVADRNGNHSLTSPQTGDNEPYIPFLAVMTVCIAGGVGFYFKGKRTAE